MQDFGMRVSALPQYQGLFFLGFWVSDFGFRVSGLGSRISGIGLRISGFGFQISGLESRVSGFGITVIPRKALLAMNVPHPEPYTPSRS